MKLNLDREEFINQYPPFNLINTKEAKKVFDRNAMHLYVHLPFCKHKCGYCYFKSFQDYSKEFIDTYLFHLKKEIDKYSNLPEVQTNHFKSLYFGGGTPTLLSCKQLEDIVTYVQRKFSFTEGYELCLEANPDEEFLTDEKFQLLFDLGVKRISFGVQNFSDEILKLNERKCNLKAFFRIYEKSKKMNFNIINIDIMSGLLGETRKNWQSVITKLLELHPENIAFYKMELYYNTQLFKNMRKGTRSPSLMSNEEEINLIQYAYDRLQDEGQYQVANCFNLVSDSSKEHLHRKGIWQGDDMLGVGVTAHSCFNDHVYQNTPNLKEYYEQVSQGILPIKRAYKETARDEISKAMVYGIKSLQINRQNFIDRFGIDIMSVHKDKLEALIAAGYLTIDNHRLKVPRKYYIFADDICREFFLPEYQTMMLAHHSRT